MIQQLVMAISAIVFMLGALGIGLTGIYIWAYLVIGAAKTYGWGAGAIVAILSIAALSFWGSEIRRPWDLWVELWLWCDKRLESMQRRTP